MGKIKVVFLSNLVGQNKCITPYFNICHILFLITPYFNICNIFLYLLGYDIILFSI